MNTVRQEIGKFVTASEILLGYEVTASTLNEEEGRLIQYYLSALAEKFPALLD